MTTVPIVVRVNHELLLDAGIAESDDARTEVIIRPPRTTLFHQVLAYLRAKPDPPCGDPWRAMDARTEGMAAVSVILRWGSYFSVLADGHKPMSPHAREPGTSRIGDAEMARINIEASAALAEWVDIAREGDEYWHLARRALHLLPSKPLPRRSRRCDAKESRLVRNVIRALAHPPIADKIVEAAKKCLLPEVFANISACASGHPSRLFANAVVNTAYRNGPIEDVHAGKYLGHSLDHRRVTAREEAAVLGFAAEGLGAAMDVCGQMAREHSRSWHEQALPYGLNHIVAPFRWTLTESCREVRFAKP